MKRKKSLPVLIVFSILLFAPSVSCGSNAAELASVMPSMPLAVSAGYNAALNEIAEIDASNTKYGYIAVKHLKTTNKTIKVIIKKQGGTPYIYTLRADREYEVFPLSEGSGYYHITVCENVFGNKYMPVLTSAENVRLTNELAPFMRPNQYVDYSPDSKAAEKAAELTRASKNTADKISVIYSFVTENIAYDHRLAADVQKGYIPDVDRVLKNGKGICFDYASLMTAMLRSQGVPAKLVVGYRRSVYHAWISVYSGDADPVDKAVCPDGKGWKYIDPSLASGGSPKYIEDENNYIAKYIY